MEQSKDSKKEFDNYLKMIRRGKNSKEQKVHLKILICFSVEEMMLLNSQKAMAQ